MPTWLPAPRRRCHLSRRLAAGIVARAKGTPAVGRTIRLWPLMLLALLACLAANVAGGFFGLVAAWLYLGIDAGAEAEGILLGGSAALLAAAMWCALLLRAIVRRFRAGGTFSLRLYLVGLAWAASLGAGAALIVHVAMAALAGRWGLAALPTALGLGVATGLVLGAVLGLAAWAAAALAQPRRGA